jgi:hypothetical protein
MAHDQPLPLTARAAALQLQGFFDGELARIDAEIDHATKGPSMTFGSIVRRRGQELACLRREQQTLLRTKQYVVGLVAQIHADA